MGGYSARTTNLVTGHHHHVKPVLDGLALIVPSWIAALESCLCPRASFWPSEFVGRLERAVFCRPSCPNSRQTLAAARSRTVRRDNFDTPGSKSSFEVLHCILHCILAHLGVVKGQTSEIRQPSQRRHVAHLRVVKVQLFETRQAR